MRTTILSTALPNRDSGSGASITLALIAEALRDRGHDVSLCPVVYPEYRTPDGADHEAQLAHAARCVVVQIGAGGVRQFRKFHVRRH